MSLKSFNFSKETHEALIKMGITKPKLITELSSDEAFQNFVIVNKIVDSEKNKIKTLIDLYKKPQKFMELVNARLIVHL
jgi:hypothetical protein